jgi:opacity protein-like surface antigen
MKRFLLAAGLALALIAPALAEELPSRPDDAKTPGVVGSTEFADVCGRVDGRTYSQRHRKTTAKIKRDAYAAYDIEKAGRDFEVDHRVPLCAGGADDSRNLWPQRGWLHPSFHDKDRLEAHVCRAVCRTRTMTVQEGQAIFLGDWVAEFERVFGQPPE